jgi:uncharacterized damage-inducible protein DinB
VALAAQLRPEALAEVVCFEFGGGGHGEMTRAEILLHIVNHGTYHRGLVSDMLCQAPADNFPVFLRNRR